MSASEERGTQRYAKQLDTAASLEILHLIGMAESSDMYADYENAFKFLDSANARLPSDIRMEEAPTDQLKRHLNQVALRIEDFRNQNEWLQSLSPRNLARVYEFDYLGPIKHEKFGEVKAALIDVMQENHLYFAQTKRFHKGDAPMMSEI